MPRLLAEWEAGATIVLQALHVNWHPLAVFCRALEEALGHARAGERVLHAARLAGLRGAPRHARRAVLQVAGEKRWLLYEPLLELPLKHQRYSAALGEHGEPIDDFVLRAGDSLYLPRGWLHEAETSDDRLAPPHHRDRAAHVARRRTGRTRRARGRALLASGRRERRDGGRARRADRGAVRARARRAAPAAAVPRHHAGRSARTGSRSCARSSDWTHTRRSSVARRSSPTSTNRRPASC